MTNATYLILENGMVFEGRSFGAQGEITGEIVFTTGMTGYLETLTDQSYYGQIVLQTFPLIGNYGVIPADFESSSVGARAYIVKRPCQNPSNFRSEGSLDAFLKERGIVGLCGIDTRALTKIIRESGVMNGKITAAPPAAADRAEAKAYAIRNAVASVSSRA
ncbi:MAG: carbamoyl phosphate synthase small subunit, partial [Firmicutes bacterium]|nr:carbamoyl phosphate synthase small subunit [Bacillota bacterium]